MNFVNATLSAADGGLAVRLGDGTQLALPAGRQDRLAARRDQPIILGLRPEHMSRALQGDVRPGLARYSANIELLQPTGSRTYATSLGHRGSRSRAHDVAEINQRIELKPI
jgi:multiple sugar transport system ATP-binding protein